MAVRDLDALRDRAMEMRREIIQMMGPNKAHHFGGSLSAADLVTALYFYRMRYDAARPDCPERDRFIMSKGHCVPAQYAALAMLGVFPSWSRSSASVPGCRGILRHIFSRESKDARALWGKACPLPTGWRWRDA
jgi:transketolase N-terminal domain/subunit